MAKILRVLIIEDNPDDAELLVAQLEREQYTVFAKRVETALAMSAALDQYLWDVIVSDYSLPSFDAIAALSVMQSKGIDRPFIIVSGVIGEATAVAAMKAGAHDYLLKQDLARLVPAIERELREAQVRSQFTQAMAEIEQLAFYDPLTGLPNKNQFLRHLQDWINQAPPTELFGVLYLDIDRYKNVKYGFGHDKSERFLIEVAHRLKALIADHDYLARVGEDSFALLLAHLPDQAALHQRVAQVHERMGDLFHIGHSLIHTSVGIGVADNTLTYTHPEDLLCAADTAMHSAKQQGVPTVFFNRQMRAAELQRIQIEAHLQQAIPAQDLQLHYQPIIALGAQRVIGFEALLRWQHAQQGWIFPNTFIPIAEQTGLIIPLGEWIFAEACRQIARWQSTLAEYGPLIVSVNLSGIQLEQPDLAATIRRLYQCSPDAQIGLGIEITESVLMTKLVWASRLLKVC